MAKYVCEGWALVLKIAMGSSVFPFSGKNPKPSPIT
jgi:hypothetical protein